MKRKNTLPCLPDDLPSIDKILASTDFSWDKETDVIFTLQYGRKSLDLLFETMERREWDRSSSYLSSIGGVKQRKHEMTLLYLSASVLLQYIANRTLRDIRYQFESAIPHLQAWARSSGNDIFHWSKKRKRKQFIVFTSIIQPDASLRETPAAADLLDEIF